MPEAAQQTDEELALALIALVRKSTDPDTKILQKRIENCLGYLDQVVAANVHTLAHVRRYLDGSYDGMGF
jgi:hypothetical protein